MNIDFVLKAYLEELESEGFKNSEIIKDKIENEISISLPWTQEVWKDSGVPITKYFRRCRDWLNLKLSEGTEIAGVKYFGSQSGCHMFDFYLNGTWYSAQKLAAVEMLAVLGKVIEPLDADFEPFEP